jgi:transposase
MILAGEVGLQSAPKSRHESFAVIEGVADRLDASPPLLRRRWSVEAKARIVEESMTPGANVSAVARAHGLSPQQVFAWRRKAIRCGAITILPERAAAEAQSFAPVEVAHDEDGRAGGLEIVIGDATIRVDRSVAPTLLIAAIRAVRSA